MINVVHNVLHVQIIVVSNVDLVHHGVQMIALGIAALHVMEHAH